jgi:membrane protein insertase Oxa1/YidC/SpoIIIJ
VKTLSPQTLGILQQTNLISFANGFTVNTAVYDALTSTLIKANGLTGVMNGWFILPLIAGGSLFLQQKLMAAGGQTQQQQMKFMLYFFPLFSIFICATSNTAFAVYWLASNVYAIAQQVIINWLTNKKAKTPLTPIKEGKS